MRICVLVHPGTLFSSAHGQIEPDVLQQTTDLIAQDIQFSDALIVIDGTLSDTIPRWFNDIIREKLDEACAAELPAYRLWGCDAGEPPYKAWSTYGDAERPVSDGQQEAILGVIGSFEPGDDILVTGAWASRNGASGCVNSVVQALQSAGIRDVSVSENALLEPDEDALDIEMTRD